MTIMGIDPGLSGAVALYNDRTKQLRVYDIPTIEVKSGKRKRREVDDSALSGLLEWADIEHVFIEKVGAMPGQGVTSMFRFGEVAGVIRGIVAAHKYPRTYVTPQKWKKHHGLSGSDKGASRRRACELLPEYSEQFSRVKDEGRAEAALIALYGAAQLGAEVTA